MNRSCLMMLAGLGAAVVAGTGIVPDAYAADNFEIPVVMPLTGGGEKTPT